MLDMIVNGHDSKWDRDFDTVGNAGFLANPSCSEISQNTQVRSSSFKFSHGLSRFPQVHRDAGRT